MMDLIRMHWWMLVEGNGENRVDYEGIRCIVFQYECECDWLWMVISEGKWDSWRGVRLLVLFLSCRDCIWMNGVVWTRIGENWRWRYIRFRIWGCREDEEIISWSELNDGIVGMIQSVFLFSINMNSKCLENLMWCTRGMNGRLMRDGLVVVKEEWDLSSVKREMKNREWRDAESSWVEFGSRDPFHLPHAFPLPFFMIREANNAYLPFWQKPSCFGLNKPLMEYSTPLDRSQVSKLTGTCSIWVTYNRRVKWIMVIIPRFLSTPVSLKLRRAWRSELRVFGRLYNETPGFHEWNAWIVWSFCMDLACYKIQ